jgi:TBC1 domain family member 2A
METCLLKEYVHVILTAGDSDVVAEKTLKTKQASTELMELLSEGIPADMRVDCWIMFRGALGSDDAAKSYYLQLLQNVDDLHVDMVKQIEQDLPRTFPRHPLFKKNTGTYVEKLSRVLKSYALRNVEVGYCQSMNFLCGLMLLLMDEHQALMTMANLVESTLQGFYEAHLKGLHVELRVLSHWVDRRIPKLAEHLTSVHAQLTVFVVQWFICAWTGTLPTETALCCWDAAFALQASSIQSSPGWGAKDFFLRIAAVLVLSCKDELLEAHSPGEVYRVLKEAGQKWIDPRKLFKEAAQKRLFSAKVLGELREKYGREIDDELSGRGRFKREAQLGRRLGWNKDQMQKVRSVFDYGLSQKEKASSSWHTRTRTVSVIAYDQLPTMLQRIDDKVPWREDTVLVDRLFRIFNRQGDDVLSFEEFASGMAILHSGTLLDRCYLCFRCFDLDGTHSIAADELEHMLIATHRMVYGDNMCSPAGIRGSVLRAWAKFDLRKEERLGLESFKQIILEDPAVCAVFRLEKETTLKPEDSAMQAQTEPLAVPMVPASPIQAKKWLGEVVSEDEFAVPEDTSKKQTPLVLSEFVPQILPLSGGDVIVHGGPFYAPVYVRLNGAILPDSAVTVIAEDKLSFRGPSLQLGGYIPVQIRCSSQPSQPEHAAENAGSAETEALPEHPSLDEDGWDDIRQRDPQGTESAGVLFYDETMSSSSHIGDASATHERASPPMLPNSASSLQLQPRDDEFHSGSESNTNSDSPSPTKAEPALVIPGSEELISMRDALLQALEPGRNDSDDTGQENESEVTEYVYEEEEVEGNGSLEVWDMEPGTSSMAGGMIICLTGCGFEGLGPVEVQVGTQSVTTTILSEDTLTFRSPAWEKVEALPVRVSIPSKQRLAFAPSLLQYFERSTPLV